VTITAQQQQPEAVRLCVCECVVCFGVRVCVFHPPPLNDIDVRGGGENRRCCGGEIRRKKDSRAHAQRDDIIIIIINAREKGKSQNRASTPSTTAVSFIFLFTPSSSSI